jgi:hypothetical protein
MLISPVRKHGLPEGLPIRSKSDIVSSMCIDAKMSLFYLRWVIEDDDEAEFSHERD